jgi:lipoprotein LprG
MTTLRARAGIAVLLSAVLLAATGCSGSDNTTLTPTQTLAAAKKALDSTSGVHIMLSTTDLPRGINGLVTADGVGTHDPAFQGQIKVANSGLTANASVVAVNGVVYAKLPFTTKFVQIQPSSYGAPDPAALMSSRGGLSSLLTAAKGVKKDKQVRNGSEILTSYTGKVPGKLVQAVVPSAAAGASFDATFTLSKDNHLAKAVLTGPFYPKAGNVTYTVAFDQYGIQKHITAP